MTGFADVHICWRCITQLIGNVMFLKGLFTSLLLGIAFASAANAAVHPSHSSMTEVEWNGKSNRFEVAMRLYIADLEDAISVRLNRRFHLETDKDAAKQVQQYLAEKFSLTSGINHNCRLHWVGMELELHDAWFYFEAESVPAKAISSDLVGDGKTVDSWDELLNENAAGSQPSQQATSGPFDAVHIKHSALTEVQPEQTNVVSVTVGRRTSSAILTASNPENSVSLRQTGISKAAVKRI